MTSCALWSSYVLVALATAHWSNGQHLCSVFQPFRITPENPKFQIGGPFPLHTADCLHVRPDIVQELIGVQWAISQWNQNPENAHFQLAFSAYDTCSRGRESLSQTIAFLHESGYFNPRECQSNDRIPLGLIMPTAQDARLNGLKESLIGAQAPLIAFAGSTAQSLFDADVPTVFSTAPNIDHFMQATIALLKSLESDVVSLLYSDQHVTKATLEKQLSALTSVRISTTRTIPIADTKSSHTNSTEIVIVIASKDEAINYFMTSSQLYNAGLRKLFIIISALGETWTESEITEFLLPKRASYNLVIIQQGSVFNGDEFRDYLFDVLRNNYENFAILASYMQQVYNCTLIGSAGMIDCGRVDIDLMIRSYSKNRRVESAVLATYIYGAVAKYVAAGPDDTCSSPSPQCTRKILAYLKDHMTYTFRDSDPPSYHGFVAQFGPDRTLNSLPIEGFYVTQHPKFRMESIFNFTTGSPMDHSDVLSSPIVWSDGIPVKVRCDRWRPECQTCSDQQKFAPESDLIWIPDRADLYIIGLFNMRRGLNANSRNCDRSIDDPKHILMPAAFEYVFRNIGSIGGIIFDSCNDHLSTIETVLATRSQRCLVGRGPNNVPVTVPSRNIMAVATGQRASEYDMVERLLGGLGDKKPFIGLDHHKSHDSGPASYFDLQSQAIAALLIQQGWNYVSVLLSEHDEDCSRAYESFRRLAESDGKICIADVVHVKSGERIELIRNANSPMPKIALTFTTAQDTILALKTSSSYRSSHGDLIYIFTGDAHDWEAQAKEQSGAHTWKALALGGLSVQPRLAVDEDFKKFLANLNPKNNPHSWLINFWEDYFKCSMNNSDAGRHTKLCTGGESLHLDRIEGRMTREAYFISAMERFAQALDQFSKKACPEGGFCDAFFNEYGNITEIMAQMEQPDQFVIYNYRSQVDHVNGGEYVEIGTWTNTEGLHLNDTWTWYDEERNANHSIPDSSCQPPKCHCRTHGESKKTHNDDSDETQRLMVDQEGDSPIKSTNKNGKTGEDGADVGVWSVVSGGQWKKQVWTYIFLVINTILLLSAGVVLTVVSVKLCCGLVKGNQSLGVLLLFSVMLLYATAYFFIFDPCETLCRLRYIAHSVSYSVCFGVMIAKAVQLRNSESLGFNGYISYWNYWLLLFFIVAVQIALNMQWAIVRNPVVVPLVVDAGTTSSTVILRCSWSTGEFLASQSYVILLLCMALFMALLNRNVKRNYKETRWLMCTSLICIGTWALWTVAYAVTPDAFKDTVVVMELMICATVVLCFMFGPKLYILLHYKSMLNVNASDSKLPEPTITADEMEKRKSIALEKDDAGIHYFDVDDFNEDGRQSVLSSGSVKSAITLCHTLSLASTGKDDSSVSSAPVKNRRSRNSEGAAGSASVGSPASSHRASVDDMSTN